MNSAFSLKTAFLVLSLCAWPLALFCQDTMSNGEQNAYQNSLHSRNLKIVSSCLDSSRIRLT